MAPWAIAVVDVHGAEDVGGFEAAAAAGGAGGGADVLFAEEEEDGFGFEAGEADVGGVGEAGVGAAVDVGLGDCGEDALVRGGRGGRRRGAISGRAAVASSAALPMPTMPGTFSVPPRRSRSWGPPMMSGTSGGRGGCTARRRLLGRGICGWRSSSASMPSRRRRRGFCRRPACRRSGRGRCWPCRWRRSGRRGRGRRSRCWPT